MKMLFKQMAICFFTLFANMGVVHAQTFSWVRGGGSVSSTNEQVSCMFTDPNGNIYALSIVGNDPVTADTFSAISGGVNPNILLTSYNCSGQMRWAKLLQNTGYGVKPPYGLQADSLGNVYVSGSFAAGGTNMYIGYDTTIGPPTSDYLSVGLIQFDTSGHFNWIEYVGPNTFAGEISVSSGPITIDGTNNVHYFCDVKSGVTLMTGVTSVYGVYDMTYNTSGVLLSAVRLDLDSEFYLQGAVIDPATNKLYAYGQGGMSGGLDTFLAAAYGPSRNLLWQYFAGHGDDDGFTGIALDQYKYLHFCGSAALALFIFNGDTASNTHYSSGDISILMTTDTNGTVQWLKHYDGDLEINGFNGITLLPNNKIAAFGTFVGEVIDAGGANIITPAGDGYGPYFVIVDSAGDLQTIQQILGDGFYNSGNAITSDKVGNIYVGGAVVDSIWAGTLITSPYISVGGPSDFFVMKYGVDCSCTSSPVANYTDTGTITIGFTYTGTTSGIDSVVWNFGDGSPTVNGITPIHSYTASGTYNACATVYTDCGSDIHCSEITVSICTTAPIASFSDTGTQTVGFTYTGTIAGIDSVVWNFGDGNTDTGMNPVHNYAISDTYNVCVTVYTSCGNDTVCNSVVVPPLGVPVLSLANVQVFPNPTSNELNITGILQSTNYRLLDVTGECVQQGILINGSNTLSMKIFAPGVYILEMTGVDGTRDIMRVVKE